MIVGVSGFNASGKSELCKYLAGKGFEVMSLSDVIRDHALAKGLQPGRDELRALGNELRTKHGAGYLARALMQKTKSGNKYCFDSVRNPEEIREFRKANDFTLVFVDAPIAIRYERAKLRGRSNEGTSLEEFQDKERKECQSGDPTSQQLLECRRLADHVIVNDESISYFHEKIESILR